MLFLYYTNSDQFNQPQDRPDRSLGGYISSTPLPNDQIGNLFSDLDLITLEEGYNQTKGIGLKNIDSAKTIVDLKAWIVTPEDALAQFEIAFVTLSKDDCGDPYMEKLNNAGASPYYATFYSPTVDDKLSVPGELGPNQYLGVWIRRKIPTTSQQAKTCEQVFTDYSNNQEVKKLEQFGINFEWNYKTEV